MGSFWPRADRYLGLPSPAVTQPGAETCPELLRACIPSHRQDPHSQNLNRSLLGSRDHEGLIGQVSATGPPGPRAGGDRGDQQTCEWTQATETAAARCSHLMEREGAWEPGHGPGLSSLWPLATSRASVSLIVYTVK